jgi:iron(II)-dependent oxidoreductase
VSLARAQTPPLGGVDPLDRAGRIAALLEEARERTLWLVEDIDERDMDRVHSPLMSPLVWDLGHIAAFEDLWLGQRAGGREPLRGDLWEVYDATETPRRRRGDLPYLRTAEALDYLAAVRERSLEVLERADFDHDEDRLNRDGFVWEMVVQHEHQHNETMLQTLCLAEPGVWSCEPAPLPPPAGLPGGTVRVDAGPFLAGAPATGFAYDNERPRHPVDLPAFEIDRLPVTNGDYLEFVLDGGYRRRSLWTPAGWDWRRRENAERPLYWTADGHERRLAGTEPIDPSLPVMHVSWFEAHAYARWRGMRLPTELEWEKAAAWAPGAAAPRRWPWGDDPPQAHHANLDQLALGPAPVGSHPDGCSGYGVAGMIGDAWEWTASPLSAYPGFSAWPYAEYSSIFFGDGHRVLRGGSWATRPLVARNTFRNWDLPGRRQIFSGFRCARDAA